jgi:predicted nucleotidyltransferase
MKRKINIDIFSSTNPLKILTFLVENPGKEFLGSEVQKATSLSRAGVYVALRELIKQNLSIKTQKGKFIMYSVAYNNPVIKQFKVLRNIISLRNMVLKLKPLSKKIILYGSAGRGEDDVQSDIDLFILSKDPISTKTVLSSVRIKRKIQSVVKSPSEFVDFKEREKIFCDEINRGIILWEETG